MASRLVGLVSSLGSLVMRRLAAVLEAAPPGALRVTGLLGLAAALYLAYSYGGGRPKPPDDGAALAADPAPRGRSARPGSVAGPPTPTPAAATPAAAALRARLGGARVVTLSAPGLLLEEWEPEELESGATLRPGAAAAVRALVQAVPGGVYLVARVGGDVGEAAVRAALEAGGVVVGGGGAAGRSAGGGGGGAGAAAASTSGAAAPTPPSSSPRPPPPPIPPQRLLFCETVTGKVALARQLEAGLHLDGCAATIDELARFVPRLVFVGRGGGGGGSSSGGGGGPAAAGVVCAGSLPEALGLGGGHGGSGGDGGGA